jgi:hypothetical protein
MLALGLGLVAGALLAEGAARWLHDHPSPPPPGSEAAPPGMFLPSDRAGVQLAPSFSYPAERFTTNRLGLRDRERPTERTDRLRIALLGDSFTAGVGVDDVQHSAALLEASLGGPEVWNLGTPHYGLEQSAERLEELWFAVQPDVVVLQVFPGNDPWDDARGPGFLRLIDGEIARAGWAPSGSALDPLRSELHRPLFAHHLPGDGPFWRHSYAYRAGLGALSAVVGRFASDDPWGMEPFDYELFGAVAWLYLDPPPPPIAGAWRVSEAAIDRIQAFVAAQGATLVVVGVPSRLEVDESDLGWALENGWDSGSRPGGGSVDRRRAFNVDLPQRTLAAITTARALPLLDLRPAFRAAGVNERMHYLDDSHWTAGGHREAARALGRFLEARGLLSTPSDFDDRLAALVPEASFEVEFEGGFRPESTTFAGDGRQVAGVRGDSAGSRSLGASDVALRLIDPVDLLPLLPPAPEGWTRSPPAARIAPLLFPRDDVLVAQAEASYTDSSGRRHRVLALDGAGQPEIDRWFRDLGGRAVLPPAPQGVLRTAARLGVVLPESALGLASAVNTDVLAALEARLAPTAKVWSTLTLEDQETGRGPPRGARKRLQPPEALVAALPAAPGWQILETLPLIRPHNVPEFLRLPQWMEDRLNTSDHVAGHNEEPWSAEAKRWLRGPEGSFVVGVQDTGHNELLLRSRQKRLVALWGPQPGVDPPPPEASEDPRLQRFSSGSYRGFRACRSEQGLCTVVVPLVDFADPDAVLARYNAVLQGPMGAPDSAYVSLLQGIQLHALP